MHLEVNYNLDILLQLAVNIVKHIIVKHGAVRKEYTVFSNLIGTKFLTIYFKVFYLSRIHCIIMVDFFNN